MILNLLTCVIGIHASLTSPKSETTLNEPFTITVKPDELCAYSQLCSNIKNTVEHGTADLDRYKKTHDTPDVESLKFAADLLKNSESRFLFCLSQDQDGCMENFANEIKRSVELEEEQKKLLPFKCVSDALLFSKQHLYRIDLEIEQVNKRSKNFSNMQVGRLAEYPIFKTGYFQNYEVRKALYRNGNEFSGAVIYNPKTYHIVIAFAGDKSKWDVLKSVYIAKAHGNAYVGAFQSLEMSKGTQMMYLDSAKDLLETLQGIVKSIGSESGKIRFTTTGHSLGGALALLAAYHIKESFIPSHNIPDAQVQCVNFGCPRIFKAKSAEKVESLLGRGNIIRFWNDYDLIPAIIPGFLSGTKHVGTGIMLKDTFISDFHIPFFGAHSVERYYDFSASFEELVEKIKDLEKTKDLKKQKEDKEKLNGLILRKETLQKKIDNTLSNPVGPNPEYMDEGFLLIEEVAELQSHV